MILGRLTSNDSAGKSYNPPALIVPGVEVKELLLKTVHPEKWDGFIDTGSGLTILPESMMSYFTEVHGLCITGKRRVRGFDHNMPFVDKPAIDVELSVPGIEDPIIVNAAFANRKNILVGRDALAQMVMGVDWERARWAMKHSTILDLVRFPFWRWLPLTS